MLLARLRDPIAAVATASGRGAVGIVRASGPDLAPLVQALFGRALTPRTAMLLPFTAADGSVLDRGLAIHFPAPQSYTGEDVLELQAHGGPVLLQLLLARVLEAGAGIGLRLARAGEFTERAFLNDKIDLAQAEAVADLIDASTEAAARSAARSLDGAFSAEIHTLARHVVDLRTLVEATLDFPEEEIDFLEKARARERLDAIEAAIGAALARARQGALLREGMRVVIAGQPNVGKSSLLNALAGAELAIVTPIPGTTRDRVAETIQIEGVPLHVVDTAGLREHAADEVERIGIGRSWEAIEGADAVLFVHDLTRRGDAAYEAAEAEIAARLQGADLLHVHNKADAAAQAPGEGVVLSAKAGTGLEVLRRELLRRAGWQPQAEGLFTARARHVAALQRTLAHLNQAQAHAGQRDAALDLLAEELRLAHQALGEITGEFGTEDLLGEIFGRFCIGK
ncbi:tRNA uridine-5-carboxymethylaminomethyl(34) synthesis GTPase MnmE [Rubrivivax gelatinosus]|uniref:tRNA modification GTPase MnmE n=1 Tax=Rubrivivax gelatinosus TaxID=28068 RepID=A0A4R2M6D5_RUBGE|nr:tRNA uridine-5-carboxymethylaminomethyl(34) synthesis GTPase MnmE [Rubrivivax gelatinosus]MBK1690116.1 tRNA uridine-5-carboxymethylaminomethyl(34) synthesis GTPase MnmE [Rubrivivax gelatinosus]TCP00415.1 tRNA modification GTPase trmE [Rubrivivax gelatinosus]